MRNPYITGPYVLGRRHYGRSDLLDRLLHGESHAYWVIGNRRIGKTSLLRQLETLALTDERLLPVFWDMQGCDNIERLGCYLADAIQERLDELLAFGLSVEIVREENVLTLLPALRRTVARAGRELLLLCDETEVLLNIACEEPELAQRLHHELTYGVGQRVVAVSTRTIYQMHEVCRSWPTSPFLAGFDMSQMLGSLDAASVPETEMPRPRRNSRSPSSRNRRSERSTVLVFTPRMAARSLAGGRRSPGFASPSAIARRISAATCSYRSVGSPLSTLTLIMTLVILAQSCRG